MEEDKDMRVLCFTETWITERKQDLLKLENFNCGTSYCRRKREGGGVCILVKEGIEYKERIDITDIATEYVLELCALEIPGLDLLVTVLYWPEKNRNTDLFFSSLDKLLRI